MQPIQSAEDLGKVPVARRNGKVLRLSDLGTVKRDHQPIWGEGVINDEPGLMLIVQKFRGANTMEVTNGIEDAMKEMQPGLPSVEVDTTIFRPATFIEQSIDNLTRALLIGILLVILIIVAFLFEWRTAFISLIAIPLSLLAAILVLDLRDATINVMVLAGLVVAIGVVVDDAIIDVENMVRRLRQARAEGSDVSTFRIVLDASVEVRTRDHLRDRHQHRRDRAGPLPREPLRRFLPAAGGLLRPGGAGLDAGRADRHAGAVPADAVERASCGARDSPLLRVLKRGYGAILARVIRRPSPAILTAVVCMLAGLLIYPTLGNQLLPNFKERDFLMHWLTEPGTSAPEETRISVRACKDLREIPGVRNCGSHIGQALMGDEVYGVDFGENWISVDKNVDYDDTLASVHRTVEGYPGPLPRRADLPARAHQGGPHGDERVDRRARLRTGPRGAARQVRGDLGEDRQGRRRDRRASELLGGPAAASRSSWTSRRRSDTASSRATSAGSPRRCSRARRSATSSTAAGPTTCTCGASRRRATA